MYVLCHGALYKYAGAITLRTRKTFKKTIIKKKQQKPFRSSVTVCFLNKMTSQIL